MLPGCYRLLPPRVYRRAQRDNIPQEPINRQPPIDIRQPNHPPRAPRLVPREEVPRQPRPQPIPMDIDDERNNEPPDPPPRYPLRNKRPPPVPSDEEEDNEQPNPEPRYPQRNRRLPPRFNDYEINQIQTDLSIPLDPQPIINKNQIPGTTQKSKIPIKQSAILLEALSKLLDQSN